MRIVGVLVVAQLFGATLAAASPNDFRLNARRGGEGILFNETVASNGGRRFAVNQPAWEALAGEMAMVMSPRIASPAETLGHAGFHVGALWSGTFVSNSESYWFVTEDAQDTGTPNSVLQTLQLEVRKGLPYSLEIGANLLWLVGSEMLAPGIELRWAVHEGFHYTPDIAIRGTVNHMIGNRDMNLTVIGLDAVVSRSFGLGGMINVAPYASYALLMVAASSRVIDPTPTDESDPGNNLVLPRLEPQANLHHKITLGSRVLISILNITVQGEFEFLRDEPTGVRAFGPIITISTKLGLDY